MQRRSLLRAAASAALAGRLNPAEAQHVHQHHAEAAAQAGGVYRPKSLNAHEFSTLQSLSDLIIPPEGDQAGGAAAGAAEFIDTLCSGSARMAAIFTGGLAWLDHATRRRCGSAFLAATLEQQHALLDLIAYRRNASPELNPGIEFFDWARRLVVDAWTTSPAGFQALGYQGNRGMTSFEVPAGAIKYAFERSPFREG